MSRTTGVDRADLTNELLMSHVELLMSHVELLMSHVELLMSHVIRFSHACVKSHMIESCRTMNEHATCRAQHKWIGSDSTNEAVMSRIWGGYD